MSAVEIVAFVATVVSIWLGTKQNVWYYPLGIVSVSLYAVVYVQARLYAESGLQAVWFALMIYGWYEWLHGGKDHGELTVSRTPRRAWVPLMASGLAVTAVVTLLQRRFTDNPAPLVDSAIAAFSIVAQAMTAWKWIENWLFWIVINVAAVALYINRQLYLTAVLYGVLFFLGIKGYLDWRKSLASA